MLIVLNTKDKILQEALLQFNEKGLNNVGVREIARSLNISPGNMSYHFPKKEDLIQNLLETYSLRNTSLYEEYMAGAPSLDGFVGLFRNIFSNQYAFRGVFVGNYEIQKLIRDQSVFDYAQLESKRKQLLREILGELVRIKHLKASAEQIEFLLSFLTLFGRFWIMEAFLIPRNVTEKKTINHYINLLEQQLSLFATTKGKAVLN